MWRKEGEKFKVILNIGLGYTETLSQKSPCTHQREIACKWQVKKIQIKFTTLYLALEINSASFSKGKAELRGSSKKHRSSGGVSEKVLE